MANNATTNATRLPILNNFICSEEKAPFSFVYSYSLYTAAASIVGTAKKNENSAAALLVSFKLIPPMIVAALRLSPGNKTARH